MFGPLPLAYRIHTCPRTSLHKCQQQGAFRSKPLSMLLLWPSLWPLTSFFGFFFFKDTRKSSHAERVARATVDSS